MGDTLHGADLVNDELEIGYDEPFEKRWIIAQNIGLVLMIAFLLVCISGVLGRGPYSHRMASSPDKSLHVDYEPVAREGTPTQITLRVSNSSALPMPVSLFVSGTIAEPLGLAHTLPDTQAALVGSNGLVLRFTLAPRQSDAMIRLATTPAAPGIVHLRAWIGNGLTTDTPDRPHIANWTQVILP